MKKIALISALFFTMLSACNKPQKLPYLQIEVTGNMKDGKMVQDTLFKTIPDFKLYNQDSTLVTAKDFDNTIYVADFFFTSCPTICPVMHRNLLKVYNKYKGNPAVKIASHTIDTKYDTPSRLKAYTKKLGVEGTQWEYLWGPKEVIYGLAERNYLVAVQQNDEAPGGFIHQGYLILVDKNKRIRGAYDGTIDKDVTKLMSDMDILLKEK
ncbi:SCO family protein [Pedobacter sp.]|uniref:SCO family protein n=1 Tax=Pedobacter sp. TaxID=1411316 RepID=UPI00396C3E1E